MRCSVFQIPIVHHLHLSRRGYNLRPIEGPDANHRPLSAELEELVIPHPAMEPASGVSITVHMEPQYPTLVHEPMIPYPVMEPASGVSITVDTAPDYDLHQVLVEDMCNPHVNPPFVVVKRQADLHDLRAPPTTAHLAL
jgi:hypothetical protein